MSPPRNDFDDLGIFRPRLGKGGPKARGERHSTFRNTLLRGLQGAAVGRRAGRHGVGEGFGDPGRRRVVVKAHIVRMNPRGARAASLHLRYIERDGVEKDGSKGVLYTADGPARAEAFEEARAGEKHQFRLIVSPEDAGELDLTAYVRRLMAQVERDLGRRVEWAAVNHFDTGHPHAHVVVRGVDQEGRELRFDRAYISKGMRFRAQEIATEELGPRHDLDVRRAHVREIAQERFTSLDREIERRAGGDGVVEIRAPGWRGVIDPSVLASRLEHLEGLRLARRVSPAGWSLVDGWQKTLRALGERGDIIKRMHRAVSGDPARYHVVGVGEALPGWSEKAHVVTGRVAGKGLSDELKGVFYAVIETPTGRAYHVPMDGRSAEGVRIGDVVSMASRPDAAVRGVDRHIAEVAAKSGGVYALARGESADAARAQARLRELEHMGLVAGAGPDRWTVAPNLIDALERAHAGRPLRHRLTMRKDPLGIAEQVRYVGPVWLDRVGASTLAPYGFGAEVRRAIAERRQVLRELGISAQDPGRFAKLSELERAGVAKDFAESSGQVAISGVGDGFRGRILLRATPSGASYCVVTDDARFVVVRATAALRNHEGERVVLGRDGQVRDVARSGPDRGHV